MDKISKIIKYIFILCSFLVVLFFIVGRAMVKNIDFNEDYFCTKFESEWFLVESDGKKIPIEVPGNYNVKKGETLKIETILPFKLSKGGCLVFRGSRQDMKIFIGNELRKEYSTKDERLFGKSSASYNLFVNIVPNDAGKKMTCEFTSDSRYSGLINTIYYGSQMGVWRMLLEKNVFEVVIAIFLLVLGLLSVFANIAFLISYKREIPLGKVGFGIILASIWVITNSKLRQLFFIDTTVIGDIPFFMIMLLPVPFLSFMDEMQNFRYRVQYTILQMCCLLDFIVLTVLQLYNIADFADTVFIMCIICIVSICFMLITIVLDGINGEIKKYFLIAIGIIGSIGCAFAQIIFYFTKSDLFNGMLITLGLVFLIIIAIIKTVRDVLKMEKDKEEAILSSKAKARFLANMSHEIRTPINAVLGIDEMILKESNQIIIKEYANDIQSAGKSLLSLINDILDFSKIESGKMQIQPVEYSVSSLISDCYQMIIKRVEDKGLKFSIKSDSKIPKTLFGDEIRIRQIIINIITNAIKYTHEGEVILFVNGRRTKEGEFILMVDVKDTGIGIKDENKDAIFDSFNRVDEKKNRSIEGTGLGLSITKHLVELMGGNISLDSTYGVGSTFKIALPQGVIDDSESTNLSIEYLKKYRDKSFSKLTLYAPSAKVLVVDDVAMNLKVFKGLLKETDMCIDTAESGVECLNKIKMKKYDIIFLDHMMPEMDGVETLEEIKKLSNNANVNTPIIMLTANAIVGARQEYLAKGFSDYLSKPVRSIDLEKIFNKYLENDKLEKKVESEKTEENNESFDKKYKFLNVKLGLTYCGENKDLYGRTIVGFYQNNQIDKIRESFEIEDWSNYRIYVHGLKSTSLTIGAEALSEEAKKMELAAKNKDIEYIIKNHSSLVGHYNELLIKIKMAGDM